MVRVRHGEEVPLSRLSEEVSNILEINARLHLPSAPVRISGTTPFGYMFPQLQADLDALLPDAEPAKTVGYLRKLGEAMSEPGTNTDFDSSIPAAYTYFGQFIDHDITLELQSNALRDLGNPKLTPLPPDVIKDSIENSRTPTPDLDSVYGVTSDGTPVPRVCSELVVSPVSPSPDLGPPPKGKDPNNDVPRKPRSDKAETDREALIGDARNDENLIVSQLHVAFLRAHRNLVGRHKLTYNEARKTLVQHYQWLIIHDFLERIAGKETVDEILTYGHRFYRPHDPPCGLYIPLEFSTAAYRFGHSMVRSSYDYNDNFRAATLKQLFSITAFSGELGGYEHVPEAWIIQWEKFLEGGNRARRIDTGLVDPLSALQDTRGEPIKGVKGNLATRNLLRGYLLRIPVGQKVAQVLGLKPLSEQEIEKAAAEVNPKQAEVLRESGFNKHTPLWYYILAESAARTPGRLGPVGRTIVAEVLIGLVRWSDDSILSRPGWEPTLGTRPGRFILEDFFRFAGVWT